MHALILLLTSCTPQDAEITGSYHAWLAENSSATVYERNLSLDDATIMDCRAGVDDLTPSSQCNWGEVGNPADESYTEPANPNFRWLRDDVFYVKQGAVEPERVEALMTSEGDFQLTVHHDLGDGEVLRYVFVIDPNYDPTVCVPQGATCFSIDGELTDDDGDGWPDFQDPDCLDGSWEVGFTDSACNDGLDNDGDGDTDAADSDCEHAFDASEGQGDGTCTDGEDNDGDSWTDYNDPDCDLDDSESGDTNALYACSNGLDDDGDGEVDRDDSQCEDARDNDEAGYTDDDPCRDDFDNDGDGWIDQDDIDCDFFDDEAGLFVTACADGVDNDGDGLTDAADPGCISATDANEVDNDDDSCVDGDDNDGDGYVDAADPDCLFGLSEGGDFARTECTDGVDNDGDGDIDEEDRQCLSALDNFEDSTGSGSCRDADLLDEDGDGWANELDPDCGSGSNEIGLSTLPCNDGVDNDGDTLVDADDLDCLNAWTASESLNLSLECGDGVDNDGDGWTDADDGGCIWGGSESDGPVTECGDGVDNDGDGLTDAADVECSWALDVLETSTSSCLDGVDNDLDGWIDNIDPDCASDGYERGFIEDRCADGIDNDGDGFIDGNDDGCANPSDPWEVEVDQCADGIDNDGDTWVDGDDVDCDLREEPFEDGTLDGLSQCNDGQDNDGDGLIDNADDDCLSAYDNVEATGVGGEPVSFPIDYYDTLTEWAADEDGYKIYYLNAGTYQLNPSDSEDFWVLPQEWLSGYATAKFGAEEFDALPNDFFYVGFDAEDPPTEEDYLAVTGEFDQTAAVWAQEPATYGFMTDPAGLGPYQYKVEHNEWRPIDRSEAGLDNWVELHQSFVRVEEGAVFEKGATFSGDYQIYLTGREAASQLILRGTFQVNKLREDIWGYDVLEDELEADLVAQGAAVNSCD